MRGSAEAVDDTTGTHRAVELRFNSVYGYFQGDFKAWQANTHQSYWDVMKKHPSVSNMENEVKLALTEPFEVIRSRQDAAVFL